MYINIFFIHKTDTIYQAFNTVTNCVLKILLFKTELFHAVYVLI